MNRRNFLQYSTLSSSCLLVRVTPTPTDLSDNVDSNEHVGFKIPSVQEEQHTEQVLDMEISSGSLLTLKRQKDKLTVQFRKVSIFEQESRTMFVHKGTISADLLSVALIVMEKTPDGHGGRYLKTVLIKLDETGRPSTQIGVLGRELLEKKDIISISEIAGISKNAKAIFAKVRRRATIAGKSVGVFSWMILDPDSGEILREGIPEAIF